MDSIKTGRKGWKTYHSGKEVEESMKEEGGTPGTAPKRKLYPSVGGKAFKF